MITENLEQVRKNIEEACRAVNRDPGEVTLISVSKTKPVSMLQEAYDAGSYIRVMFLNLREIILSVNLTAKAVIR